MDPQTFIRLSVDSLGLRVVPGAKSYVINNQVSCEIRLRGFPEQTVPVALVSSPEDSDSVASSFYLEESDLRALLAPRCFSGARAACLEVSVFTGRKGSLSHCGVRAKRLRVGTFKLRARPEWGEGKPAILCAGWVRIGKPETELHLRVRVDPDPRFVFQFEDVTRSSPQVVQLQGSIKQPIFSCKFICDRVSQAEPVSSSHWWGRSEELERRERKGWKVKIHDLSGSAAAAAFMTTPFVPSTGCDWVARSNPGAWLIVHPDASPASWHPWAKLEAWRERRGPKDSVFFRFSLMSDSSDPLVSEVHIDAEKGGDFSIDTDRRAPNGEAGPGFVMRCRVGGEGKTSRPSVQLAMRHVTCIEDAAIFMALAAAVDLSVEACRPFRRKVKRVSCHSL